MNYIGGLREDGEVIDSSKRLLIYGCGTGSYGEKIYRNLKYYHREKDVEAFIDTSTEKIGKSFHGIPVVSVDEAVGRYSDSIVCIGGENNIDAEKITLLHEIKNLHQIIFSSGCNRYGTEYGGFYLPSNYVNKDSIIYSFGIGEDLSFSEEVIEKGGGGTVYAFDPTPKAIRYVKSHRLFSVPEFHFMPYGLSDKNGKEDFYLPVRDDWVSGSYIQHENVDIKKVIQVEMRTLRTIMEELGHKRIDILKMDIEGSEFKVVSDIMNPGLKLVDCRLICMETHERFFTSQKCADVLYDTMLQNGFYDFYGTANEPVFIRP